MEHYEHVYRLGLHWDRIVSVSQRIEAEIVRLNPAFAPKLAMIHYGVPFDAMTARQRLNQRIDSALSLDTRPPLEIVYTGRMTTQQKRVLDFVDLAESLRQASVPFRLTMIGDGEELETLKHRFGSLVTQGVVRLPGRLSPEAVRAVLSRADVFVLLSAFEGLPLSLLEAMANGLAPVVRAVESGIGEVVENGVSGWITSRVSFDDMVGHLANLQRDLEHRRAMGHAAIKAIERLHLSTDDMVDAYQALFTQLFDDLREGRGAKAAPHAYNAPNSGFSVPPGLYPHFADPDDLLPTKDRPGGV